MITVVTSFSPEGFERYGREFVSSFYAHWPSDIRLLCYWERERPSIAGLAPIKGYDLLSTSPCSDFIERHASNEVVKGRLEDPRWPWGPKARKVNYSFRHDAYKFARKVFAVAHAAREVEHGRLFWIDADVVTHTAVKGKTLERLLPKGISLCYLNRGVYHSELGFVGYNLDVLETHAFIARYERQYSEDRFLEDGLWDDCNQLDNLVKLLTPHTKWIPHNNRGHPFDHSELACFMTHNKGDRK